MSLDLGYVQYIYSNDLFADPSGEVYVKGSSTRPNRLRWAPKLYVNRAQTNATYSELNATYALPHNIKLSGAVGLVTGDDPSFVPWNVGVSWNPTEPVTLDARYQAGPTADRLVLTLSLATTVNSLKEMARK